MVKRKKAADDGTASGSAPKCKWSDADDATMVVTLRNAKDNGFQADSGWKPQTWAFVVTALKDSPGPEKTADKCQDHWQKTVGDFNVHHNSGCTDGFHSLKPSSTPCEPSVTRRVLAGMTG
jgi:hypothetical protein